MIQLKLIWIEHKHIRDVRLNSSMWEIESTLSFRYLFLWNLYKCIFSKFLHSNSCQIARNISYVQ